MSVLLFIGTFLISHHLKKFKAQNFFSTIARKYISDFAVVIAIVSMTCTDMLIGVATPKLVVPDRFAPTLSSRGWLVPPLNGNPVYTPVLAFLPAILASILLFMDQQITAVICNRKEHKLNKGGGYHLDLLIVALCIIVCSVLGIPWFVAATVLTINHVKSLHMESESAAPGEKPTFLGIREQRVTHVLIFITVGLSVFMTPILGKIPMPVLYGEETVLLLFVALLVHFLIFFFIQVYSSSWEYPPWTAYSFLTGSFSSLCPRSSSLTTPICVKFNWAGFISTP